MHSQTEPVADPHVNAGYSQNSTEFSNSDEDVDRARTTVTTVDVVPNSVVQAATNNNNINDDDNDNVAGGSSNQATHHAVRSLILILALSLHHIFEGISVGLQRSVSGVFTLLIALLCHETIISFSLGLQFVKSSYTTLMHYITAFVYAIVEPIGVAVGTSTH